MKRILITLLTIFAITPAQLFAFGANGHRIVAGIAEQHLSAKAKKAIKKITSGHSLSALATWPDDIRSDPAWDYAKPWHFMSIDDDKSFDGYVHSDAGDLITALTKFEAVLKTGKASPEERWQALSFYVHLVGDIHQPLHVGRKDDRGGNSVSVQWFGKNTNLHSVWDSELLEFEGLSFSEQVSFLDHVSKSDIRKLQNSNYFDWAKESKGHRKSVYNYGKQYSLNLPNLKYNYVFDKKQILKERLQRGGIRLAGKLNEIFK